MSSRLALTLLAAALGATLALAPPALSQVVVDGKSLGFEPPPEFSYGAGKVAPGTRVQGGAAADKDQSPPPSPGCPFRDKKLELIV